MEFDIQDGEGFWRAAGADTWNPFSGILTHVGVTACLSATANKTITCTKSGTAYFGYNISSGTLTITVAGKNIVNVNKKYSNFDSRYIITNCKVKKGDVITIYANADGIYMPTVVSCLYP